MSAPDSRDEPYLVVGQPLPQCGPVMVGRGWDTEPLMVDPRVIDAVQSHEELGAYLWMGRQQQLRKQLTIRTLADWMAECHSAHTGENRSSLGYAAQLVHRLTTIGLVRTEPDQAERLAALEEAHRRWDEQPPVPPRRATPRRQPAKPAPAVVPPRPNADGDWTGPWPVHRDTATPPRGQDVVYVLRADNDLVVYVGSTGDFMARMKAHHSSGKRWSTWLAHPCSSREEAYRVESEFLQMYMPHLNVAGPSRAGGAR